MEEIKLDGSPAQLLAAEDADDDEPLSIHEPPADDGDEGDEEQTPPTPEQLSPRKRKNGVNSYGNFQGIAASSRPSRPTYRLVDLTR